MCPSKTALKLKGEMRTAPTCGLLVHVLPLSKFTGCRVNGIYLLTSGIVRMLLSLGKVKLTGWDVFTILVPRMAWKLQDSSEVQLPLLRRWASHLQLSIVPLKTIVTKRPCRTASWSP